jgi:hypothetical protein
MKNSLSLKVGVAIALVAFLGLPLFAQAQYGPPSGYEGMTPPAGYEGMTPPSGQMGPPADLQEKMNKGLARLKKSAASMRRAIKTMEKAVAGAVGVGYTVPAEITNSLAKANAAVATIEAATSIEDDAVSQAIEDFDDFTVVLDANVENLMLMTKFPKILKQADTQYNKLVKFFETTKARLVGLEADTTGAIAEVQKKVEAQKAFYDQAAALAKAGKMEDAFTMLEENFFPGLETTSQSIGVLNALKAITKTASGVARGIKTAQKIIARLDQAGLEVIDLNKIVADSNAKLAELKALLKTPGYDLEVAMAMLEALDQLREDFDNKVDELIEGADGNIGNLPTVKMFTGTKIMVPASLKGDFDNFKQKLTGYKSDEKPSDMFEVDLDSFMPEGVPSGYGF